MQPWDCVECWMPLARYFVYVGSALLALLFLADAFLPKSPVVEASDPHMPMIRIFAERQGPGPIVFDTKAMVPAAPVVAAASAPSPAAVAETTSSVRDALAQLPPSDAKIQPADPKKVEAKQPPPRKVAKRHTAPPERLAARQPQFAWFGPRMW
jgi:hypothetical protein